MSLSFLASATSTSWPHSSKSRLTQGEWVPVSMAMRIGGCSEAKRRLRASGGGAHPTLLHDLATVLVDKAEVGVPVAEVESGCRLWLLFATIHGGPILFSEPLKPVNLCRPTGYCAGGRPSHLIFRELLFHALR